MVLKRQRVDDQSATNEGLGMQYPAFWEDGESSSPLMDKTNSSLVSDISTSSLTSLQSSTPSKPWSRSPTSSPGRLSRKTSENYELKNARDALVGSVSAVINFLGSAGVPKATCEQLQKDLELQQYLAVMQRVQDYIHCIPSLSEDETLAKIHLAVTAWEALCTFKNVQHKQAYKQCFLLRYEMKGTQLEIKQAVALQVQLAEQFTACQKKLYLVQKWQRHMLLRMKRSTMIEPKGYQPIRCL